MRGLDLQGRLTPERVFGGVQRLAQFAVVTAVLLATTMAVYYLCRFCAWLTTQDHAAVVSARFLFLAPLALYLLMAWLLMPSVWTGRPLVDDATASASQRIGREIGLAVVYIGALGTLVFALGEVLLVQWSGARLLSESGQALDYNTTVMLFLWHFADLIPLVQIPETLNWEEPARNRDARAGALLVTYKVLTVIPFLAAARGIVKRLRGEGDPSHGRSP